MQSLPVSTQAKNNSWVHAAVPNDKGKSRGGSGVNSGNCTSGSGTSTLYGAGGSRFFKFELPKGNRGREYRENRGDSEA